MDIRSSFSRLKKNFKYKGSKGKPDRTGTDPGGERADPAGLLLQSVSHVVGGGSRNRDDEATVYRQQIRLTDSPLPPNVSEPVPAHGSDDGKQAAEGGVGGEPNQNHFHPHPVIELAVGSGPGQKGNDADEGNVGRDDPSPSTPLIAYGGKPDGM